jgi:uncharacterized surface protein with fasciclin (FAS1) repeats
MFDILDTIFVDGRFSRFIGLVQESGLIGEMKAAGPLALFAPTDDAFVGVPEAALAELRADLPRLRAFVRRHFAGGAPSVGDLRHSESVDALDGTSLSVQMGAGIQIGAAEVLEGDIACSNGVVHVIGATLCEDLLADNTVRQ